MANKVEARVPRGMRDMLPDQMIKRQYVIDVVQSVFEEFGFEPLQTPAVELEDTLKGKYGSEAERLIYSTTYGSGEERLSLRYDLSVPLCRVVAMYPDLPKPFKRYHIAPVWRADRPQKGRFREFYQCDADTVGSTSMLCDAEIIAVTYTILHRLGFRSFTVHINSRKLLNGIGQLAGVPDHLLRGLYQSIDKLPKIGLDGVRQELLAVGLPDPVQDSLRRVARLYLQKKVGLDDLAARLRQEKIPPATDAPPAAFPEEVIEVVEPALRAILEQQDRAAIEPSRLQETAVKLVGGVNPQLRQVYAQHYDLIPETVVVRLLALLDATDDASNAAVLQALRGQLGEFPEALEGIGELERISHYLDLLGVPETAYMVDVAMARGLEYYTGPIYETIIEEANIGSVTGGGRFDELIGLFTDRSLPAVGTSIGIERLIVVMEEHNMFPASLGQTPVQVLVSAFDEALLDESIKVAAQLRQAGLQVQVYFDPAPIREQIGYASSKDIPFLVILGPDEVASNQVSIRSLRTKQQETVERADAPRLIREWLTQV